MATLLKLPLLGQTMQEGTILRWFKKEGEAIESWEPLLEVMTDKVNMEVEPAVSGVVRKLLAGEGETVPVGAPIAVIAGADESIEALLKEADGRAGAAADPSRTPEASDTSDRADGGGNGRAAPASEATDAALEAAAEPPAVSPRARFLAEESGLDWRRLSLAGTGFEGMIVERDVRAYLENAEKAKPRMTPLAAKIAAEQGIVPEQLPARESPGVRLRAEEVRRAARPLEPAPAVIERPLVGMRKVIAEKLAAIYQAAPHVPLRVEADMAAAADFRQQIQPEAEQRGGKITYTDLIAAALVRGLLAVPVLNATFENGIVRQHGAVALGVAVALEEGLSVPVVPNAERLSLFELSDAVRELAEKARAGKLPPDAYAGGTFTLTNLGQFGVDSFDPILNPPQIGILGAGRIAERLVAHQGAPAVRPTIILTLTFDHRVVDGAPAARLLVAVKELLENPARLLL